METLLAFLITAILFGSGGYVVGRHGKRNILLKFETICDEVQDFYAETEEEIHEKIMDLKQKVFELRGWRKRQ